MFKLKLEPYLRVQMLIAGCLNVGELINGYGVGWSAPVIPKLQNPDESPLTSLLSTMQQSWIVSIVYVGCLNHLSLPIVCAKLRRFLTFASFDYLGVFLSSYLANKIGRKKTLIIGGVINTLAYLLQSVSWNLAMVLIGRMLVGIGMSTLGVTAIIYVGEIGSPNIRGIILTSLGVFHATGSLLVYSVGPFVSYAGVCIVMIPVNLLYISLCFLLPESPMFYVIKDDEASAKSTLEYLGRGVDVNKELVDMMEKYRKEQQNKLIWRELITVKSNRRSLFITICLVFFQQSSGIIAVIVFATTIFHDAGSSIPAHFATIIVGAAFVVGACTSPVFVEKCGRRLLLLVSTAGCCLSLTVLGLYFYLKEIDYYMLNRLRWMPLATLVIAIFMYSFGLSIIPQTLTGELFTPKIRSLGTSITMCCGWLSGFISATAFGYAVAIIGSHYTFWIFAGINGLAFLFVLTFVKETKGKSLMEIQVMLES